MKKIVIIIIFCFITTGCLNYTDLNDMAIVTSLVMDYQDNNYLIGFELVTGSKSGQNSGLETYIAQGKGITVDEAFADASRSVSKRLHLAHINLLIISKELAQKGISNIVDFIIRDAEIRSTMQIVVSESDVFELIKLTDDDNQIVSQKIGDMAGTQDLVNNLGVKKEFISFTDDLLTPGIDSYVMTVKIDEKKKIQTGGVAIFKNDKLKEIATIEDSRNIKLLDNRLINGNYSLKCDENNYLSIITYDSKAEYKVYENKIVAVNLNVLYRLSEDNCQTSIYELEDIKKLDKKVSEDLKNKMYVTLMKLQNKNTDIFGLGKSYYLKYNKNIKENETINFMKEVSFTVNVNAKMAKKGTINETIKGAMKSE